jgi:hypothetical protein
MQEKRLWAVIAAAGLLAILCLTLYPAPQGAESAKQTPLLCLVCGDNGGTDVILNLLLFIPFATGLRLAGWRWWQVTLACAVVSFCVELSQYFWIPGRDATLSDLITNTSGGSIAAAAAPLLRVSLAPPPREARRLVLLGVSAWIAFSVFTAWLFLPWIRSGTAVSEHPQRSNAPGHYHGSVSNVMVSGLAMPHGALDEEPSARVSDLFARESLTVSLDVVSQRPRRYRAWIYRLRIGPGILGIQQQGTTLVLEVPRRQARLEVQSPTLRLPQGAPGRKDEPFSIRAGERGHLLWLESTVEGVTRRAEIRLAPTMAWGLVIPFGYAFGPETGVLTMIWVAGLLLPLGYWAGRTEKPAIAIAIVAAAVAVGLGFIPWLSETGPVPLGHWLAAVIGVAAGWAARAPATYLASRCGSPSSSAFSSS